MSDEPMLRELFIDELAQVNGGGPVDEVLGLVPEKFRPALPPTETTMACCEEGSSGCCA